MSLSRTVRLALAAALVLSIALLPGCKKVREVASNWPRADRERSVSKPAEPPRWPLTGLDAPDEAAIKQRIVSVKVENSPAARPQTGLQDADVVYEMLTEGGITRFHALYHSTIPKAVTPVRSARMPDLQILKQYKSILAYSGANRDVNRALANGKVDTMDFSVNPVAYYRGGSKPAPHNLFVDVAKVRREAIAKRKYAETADVRGLSFAPSTETTSPATEIVIPFSPANRADWSYDAAEGHYLRQNNGKRHIDAATGEQLHADNVVVVWTKISQLSRRDVTGSPTLDFTLTGKNRASIFRGGVRIEATWESKADAPPIFRAKDGTLIKLKPGNTWFQVVPTAVNISFD